MPPHPYKVVSDGKLADIRHASLSTGQPHPFSKLVMLSLETSFAPTRFTRKLQNSFRTGYFLLESYRNTSQRVNSWSQSAPCAWGWPV
jgi:hypothetical protein